MRNKKIPTINYLVDKANTDFDKDYDLDKEEYITISYNAFEYYNNKNEGPDPLKYKIKKDSDEKYIKSSIGVFDQQPEINKIIKEKRDFSEYELDVVNGLDIYVSETWNGSQVDLFYDDRDLHIGESDYYTTISYMKILSIELLKEYNDEDSNLPIRDEYLRTESDFKKPIRPVGSTTGGVIVANTGSQWNLILGSRSEDASINSGLYSIFPNGGIKYEEVDNENFEPTLNQKFVDEIFNEQPKGSIFHDKNITNTLLMKGWNLRHGDFTTGYGLIIDSPVSYDVLMNSADYNSEVNEIIEVPINDYSMVSEILSMNNTTASVIPTISECLRMFDGNEQYPDLPYDIERL